ncbi:hypothetical protein cyc_06128 [Cyclospora cayetanensis]|uniref:WD domain, G-beta repeat-containing protein n=1 Tax=Cyclospora cayetanensis TaxID=88456 RepID=A0A1D3D318_9EIME|nr:hypothetical protein cyc_06128 [Cyclospora cayetanensis]
MEALAAPDELLTFPASLLAVGENGLQILSLPQLQPQVTLLPDVGSYQGPLEGPLGGPSHQKGPPSFAAAAVCSLGANSSIFVAALQHKPTLLYFNVTKNAAVYRQSTPTIVRCLAADSSGSFLFAGDDAGVLTVWQLSAVVLQQGASAAAPNAEAPLQHKLTPLICSWQAHDSGVCCICIHRSLLISAGRDGSLKAFQLAESMEEIPMSAWKHFACQRLRSVSQWMRRGLRLLLSLRDGRVVTAAADGIRLWRASCGVSITHIPPRQGLVLPLEGLQLLLLQHTGTQRLLSPLGLLRQHGGGGGDNSAATALCLLQRRVEQQQLLHKLLRQFIYQWAEGAV